MRGDKLSPPDAADKVYEYPGHYDKQNKNNPYKSRKIQTVNSQTVRMFSYPHADYSSKSTDTEQAAARRYDLRIRPDKL